MVFYESGDDPFTRLVKLDQHHCSATLSCAGSRFSSGTEKHVVPGLDVEPLFVTGEYPLVDLRSAALVDSPHEPDPPRVLVIELLGGLLLLSFHTHVWFQDWGPLKSCWASKSPMKNNEDVIGCISPPSCATLDASPILGFLLLLPPGDG
ncbi:hypothetical protein ACOSP7_003075 [Xanthoceras sorbifolium]